jgi:ankyrin repeat protein
MLIVTDNYDNLKKMLDESPDMIHMPDRYGRIPMYYAIEFQRSRVARLLLTYKPDLLREDRFGLSTIDYAVYYDEQFHTNFLELLLPGASINIDVYKEKWERVNSTFRIGYTLRKVRED